MNLWTSDIEQILNDVRENSIYLSTFHKKNYFYYKKVGSYFRLPTIILASIASVSSVGLTPYLLQPHISAITCLISLTVGIINSIELYMKITEIIEIELETSKQYYNLSIDLHKVLNLNQSNRQGDPKELLDVFYRRYVELFEKSSLLSISYPDRLAKLPKPKSFFKSNKKPINIPSDASSSSSISSNPITDDDIDAHL
jgi:hypothetical protein